MKKSELRAFWIGLLGTAFLSFALYRFLRSRQEIAPRPLLVTRTPGPKPAITDLPKKQKDRLVSIRGIGPVTEQKLNKEGITSYTQLALMSPAELEPYTGSRWDPQDWINQARELSEKD